MFFLFPCFSECDSDLASEIRSSIDGEVYEPGTWAFDHFRLVPQGMCNRIVPAVLTRPRTVRDVSKIVRIARARNKTISVRSGGHSYQCLSHKPHSVHLDMRSFSKVKRVSAEWSEIGTGNTWGQVREVLPKDKFTFVHGQCLDVGVGGYLMGLGYHTPGLSNAYGVGADNILEYELVLADGSIARTNAHNTTIFDDAYHKPVRVVTHEQDNDLKFALRSSGNSFAIATQFTYRTLPRPEPLPIIIPVFIEDPYDLKRLHDAANKQVYTFFVLANLFFKKPKLSNVVSIERLMPK